MPILENNLTQTMKKELSIDKQKLIEKYCLICKENLFWSFVNPKYDSIEYFSHKFAKKESILALLFHIHRLCYAKIKYFQENWSYYESFNYDLKKGFIPCEIYDMNYIKQKNTNLLIPIHQLSNIHDINEFYELCHYLEKCYLDSTNS